MIVLVSLGALRFTLFIQIHVIIIQLFFTNNKQRLFNENIGTVLANSFTFSEISKEE